MVVEFAEKSLLGKARSRPDLARQVLDKAQREGLLTTIEAAFNRLDQPLPLGYSSAGTIVAVGEGLADLRVGQRVACAGGGYAVHAEYAVVPHNLLAPLPDSLNFEAAAFTTLGAIALHGFRLAETQIGERVAVIGLGLLGLLMVEIARAAGCEVFGIDLDSNRVELARGLGAKAVVREQAEEAAPAYSRGLGYDVVLICADTTSDDPVNLAGAIARDRAKVVAVGAVGLNIPRKVYFEKELSFVNSRSYGPGRYDPTYEETGHDYPVGYVRWTEGRNLEAIVDMLGSGKLDVQHLITHRFSIERAPEAYELITGKVDEPFLGVLIIYPQEKQTTLSGVKPSKRVVLSDANPEGEVRLGVLGAGNFATAVLLPAIRRVPGISLMGVVSAAGLSAQYAAKKFGFQYAASDADQVLGNPQINTVAILTRHNLHAGQTIAALEAGKHVFCEKPLALNIQEMEKIKAVLARLGAEDTREQTNQIGTSNQDQVPEILGQTPLLMVGFNRRFAPLATKMNKFLSNRQEPLWAHYRVNAGNIPLNHWVHDPLQGGGRIIGEGCHFIDFITYLVGMPPVSVTAYGLPDSGRYREDNVVMTFTFPDGSIGTVSYLANGDKAFHKERVEVFAGGRIAVLDDFRNLELVNAGRRQVQRSRLRQDKGHQAEWSAFSQALIQGGPPPIPYNHLFGVTRASFAALESLRSNQTILIADTF
jgi:predicted dehydrogenase/threonine dehydrogenase-like Zn-dependent dehydrogenase